MRRWWCAAIPLWWLVLGPARSAVAEDMPPDAPEVLRKILEGDEFADRGTASSVWDRYLQAALETLKHYWHRFVEGLKDLHLSSRTLSSLADGIATFLELSWYAFWAIAAIVLLLVAWRILRYAFDALQRRQGEKVRVIAPVAEATPVLDDAALGQLAAAGRYSELLAALRAVLRARLLSGGAARREMLSQLATDRELLRVLPPGETGAGLFRRVAATFERAVFARLTTEPAEILELYRSYTAEPPSPEAA